MLSEGLAKNSTILGLHLEGNTASIDPAGFVQPKFNKDPMNAHVFSRMVRWATVLAATIDVGWGGVARTCLQS